MKNPDTLELIELVKQGDREASARLVQENSGLVWSVARRFFGRGVDGDDLFQIGCIGFLKAIQGFDPDFGTQFSTYAVPKISGEIRRFLRDDGAVKVSRGLKEQAIKIRACRTELEQRLGREPSLAEIAGMTGLCPEEIAAAETAAGPTQSLQQAAGEDGLTLEELLGDYGQEERLVERFALDQAIRALPERERMVVSLRYFHGLTQDKTSRIVGVSQVQVSRLEKRAIERLRGILTAE